MAEAASKAILDFTNVKEGGAFNPVHVPAGDYRAKIVKVIDQPTKNENKPQWVFTIMLTSKARASYPYRCQLQENTLWKVRNLFVAAGMNVPRKKVSVDPNKVVGKEIGITLEDDEYEGKMRSEIVAVFPTSDLPETEPAAPDADEPVEETDAEPADDSSDEVNDVEEIDVEDL